MNITLVTMAVGLENNKLFQHIRKFFFQIQRHYKIFCVNAKYGILKRVPYFFIYNFVKCQRK